MNKNKIITYFVLMLFSMCIWFLGISFGYALGGDIYTYEQDYALKEIGDILYSVSRDISFSMGLSFITYHFLICFTQSLILSKLLIKYKVSILYSCIVITYLMSMAWIGHFRASFTIFSLLFLFFSTRFFVVSLLAHSGNWGNLITYLIFRKSIFIFLILIVIALFLFIPDQFQFIFEYLGRERFFDSYTGKFDDTYFEHRSLWVVDNFKLWFSLATIVIAFKFGSDDKKYFIIIPYAAYTVFGFDAYTAQKTYLNFSFFSILGFHSLKVNLICLACKLFIILDLVYGVYSRWHPFL